MHNSMKKLRYSSFAIVVWFLLVSTFTNAQSIITDVKGVSSISLNPGFKETKKDDSKNSPKIDTVSFNLGLLTFSTAEKKINLNHYSYFQSENLPDIFFGVNASGEIKNDVANIFSSGDIVSGGEAGLRFGVRLFKNKTNWSSLLKKRGMTKDEIQEILDNYENTKPASDLWFITSGKFTGYSFKLFNPDSTFEKQIAKTNFTGSDINVGFNYWNARMLNNTILAGVTIGRKQTDNFDELNESAQEDTKVITGSSGTTRKVTTKQTVYSGEYKERIVYPLNLDIYFVPHKLENIAFLVNSRTDFSKSDKPKTKVGVGVFFLKNQNAFNPLAGVTIDYSDAFNVDNSDDDKTNLTKIKIGITTRLNIINNQLKK